MVILFFLLASGESVTRGRLEAERSVFAGELMAGVDVHAALERLFARGVVQQGVPTQDGEEVKSPEDGTLGLSREGWKQAREAMLAFGFTDGSRLEAASASEQRLRERMEEAGYITITDEAQRAFVADAVRTAAGPVLDIGCGDGRITAHLREESGQEFLGLDSSSERIDRARALFPDIQFHTADMESITSFAPSFGSAVLIDSLYFTGNQTDVLSQLLARLDPEGVIVLLYGAYAGPGMDESTLLLESLPFSSLLNRPDVAWETTDFSAGEHAIWKLRLEAARNLRADYYAARESYLYWSNRTECAALERITREGRNARRSFVIRSVHQHGA